MSAITDAYQVGQEVRIIPEAMDCPQEWMEEAQRPYWIARVDAIDGGKLDYTISTTWPPSRPGFSGCELTDDFGHHMLRAGVGDNFAQTAKNSPAVSRAAVLEEAARVADDHVFSRPDDDFQLGQTEAAESIAKTIRALSTAPASEPAAGWQEIAVELVAALNALKIASAHSSPAFDTALARYKAAWDDLRMALLPTPPGKMGEGE